MLLLHQLPLLLHQLLDQDVLAAPQHPRGLHLVPHVGDPLDALRLRFVEQPLKQLRLLPDRPPNVVVQDEGRGVEEGDVVGLVLLLLLRCLGLPVELVAQGQELLVVGQAHLIHESRCVRNLQELVIRFLEFRPPLLDALGGLPQDGLQPLRGRGAVLLAEEALVLQGFDQFLEALGDQCNDLFAVLAHGEHCDLEGLVEACGRKLDVDDQGVARRFSRE
mmetsp:Transcript_6115/g.23130  ORF Transcript_6115/g.23130 Transcript_6115/m.23130 type:complete len:220 (-) Transcript_6115:106-765(-)